jgi:hypothetical protein
MEKTQNRTLGAFEKTFWLLDQIDSKDFALAAEIDGTAPIANWEMAIKAVQRRHPNLSVKIVMDELSRPVIEHVDNLAIPLRVVNARSGYRWEQEVERELSQRFDTAQGPLVRVVLVQKPQDTVLIVAANHTLADGTSVSYLIRDLLAAVTGAELEKFDIQLSNDQTLGLPDDMPAQTVSDMPILKVSDRIVKPLVSSLLLPVEKTARLIERAREEQTTVHGAICAAVLLGSRRLRVEWSDVKMELISPICTRGVLHLDDRFGLNITTHPVFFENEQHLSFWELARLAKHGLEATSSKEHVKNYLGFFRDLVFGHNNIQQLLDILKGAFNHQIMVTNLVKVKYKTDFGALKLKSLYGPMVRSGKGMEQTIGAVSTNGALGLTNTSDAPIDGLLEEIGIILTEACDLDESSSSNFAAIGQVDQSCPLR